MTQCVKINDIPRELLDIILSKVNEIYCDIYTQITNLVCKRWIRKHDRFRALISDLISVAFDCNDINLVIWITKNIKINYSSIYYNCYYKIFRLNNLILNKQYILKIYKDIEYPNHDKRQFMDYDAVNYNNLNCLKKQLKYCIEHEFVNYYGVRQGYSNSIEYISWKKHLIKLSESAAQKSYNHFIELFYSLRAAYGNAVFMQLSPKLLEIAYKNNNEQLFNIVLKNDFPKISPVRFQ